MEPGQKVQHIPTGTVGAFVWQAPTGHVMFVKADGTQQIAHPGTIRPYDDELSGITADFIKWIPALMLQLCQDTCTCGGVDEPHEDKPAKLCARCMAERLLTVYAPLAPDALVLETQKHAKSHSFGLADVLHSFDQWLASLQNSN